MSQLVRTTSQTLVPFNKRRRSSTSTVRAASGKRARPAMRMFVNVRGPMPNRLRVCLAYSDWLVASAGISALQQLRMNSLFDPDVTSSGHQPYGFDQLASWYNRYCVYKFHITYRVAARVVSVTHQHHFASAATNSSPSSTAPMALSELPVSKGPFVALDNSGDVNKDCSQSHTVDLAKFNGKTMSQYLSDDRFQADVGANPTENLYYYISIADSTSGALSSYYYIFWKILFYAEFFDQKAIAQS